MKKSAETERLHSGRCRPWRNMLCAASFHSDITHGYRTAALCGIKGSNNFCRIEQHGVQAGIRRVPVIVISHML